MQRARSSDGRFKLAASHQHTRRADGRFVERRALQLERHFEHVARCAEKPEHPVTSSNISWLRPMVGIVAAFASATSSLSSHVGTTTTAADIINETATATDSIKAPSQNMFTAAADLLPTSGPIPGAANIINGTSSAAGTINAPSRSMFAAAADLLPTCGLVPGAADIINGTNPATSTISTLSHSTTATATAPFPTCALVSGLPIEKCGANVSLMSTSQFDEMGWNCLHNKQTDDTCNMCFCAMFRANRPLQDMINALHKIFFEGGAGKVIGEKMIGDRPLNDMVTDRDPLSGVMIETQSWQEAMAQIIENLKHHAGSLDLRGVATRLLRENKHLLTGLGIGASVFAVYWFLNWWFRLSDDDGGVNVDLEAGGNKKQDEEMEDEDELPTNNKPSIFADNTIITIVGKRIVGRNSLLQYRIHIENQPHGADSWARMKYLKELFGSAEALTMAIEDYECSSQLWGPRLLPWVAPLGEKQMKMFRLGQLWFC